MSNKQARKKFMSDFEATTKKEDCRVWAYGYMELWNKRNYKIGNNLDEFMEWCSRINADVYFHNLKYDGSFIVNWLLKNGFVVDKVRSGEKREVKPMSFNPIISNMGQWYMIDICYGYTDRGKVHTVIYDSLKKLPFKVSQIAKAFNLPVAKGEIDYKLERPIGWQITDEEHEYIHDDMFIVCSALEKQFDEGLKKMTNGSDALDGFKRSIPVNETEPKKMMKRQRMMFQKYFPVFDREMDKEFRKAYKGGFTWVNDRIKGRVIGEGKVYDVNSLYPSVMYNKLLPYGAPIKFEGEYEHDEKYPLYIQAIRCSFELKKGHIPTIQLKNHGRFLETEYLKSSNHEIVTLYVTNIDLELIKEHYVLYDEEYVGGYKFKAKQGLFKEYIDYWMNIKVTSEDPVLVTLAKLMLNSLYGKFASNPKVTGKLPYLKDDGSNGFRLPLDDDGNVDEEYKDPVYTPMGCFITAYARELTIRTAQKCYDRILYCDTDSIHLSGTEVPEAIQDIIDPKTLGYWKHEGDFVRAKFIRQKTYMEIYYYSEKDIKAKKWQYLYFKTKWRNKELKIRRRYHEDVKCAGMPENVKKYVSFNNFEVGFTCHGKLVPKQVSGGVVLIDTDFTIK